ncbi:hypothetical protein [Sporanaerobacter acetigenes]|uniref:Uncharacterized protein n=1 Tax=Sporanaerobacter acetigenes DSM 13106 TaxID=1123281 RepID=A0A1M5UA04_9FIRM|nr:hypothetical protein [Sporanaerobacter acetigenes]SHH59862.1 hypothetical protein SAMN02745180_00575 [Sporanaerobacter acetigenes DSM 13106]
MDWRGFWMEVIVASLITGVFGVLVVLITNMFVDKRGYDKIDRKIGYINNETLTKQHENISNDISYNTKKLEKSQDKEFNRIYTKVDNIDKEIYSNKEKYQNLNLDQREIRNNLDKLLFQWQNLITENKELKKEVEVLKEQNNTLTIQNTKTQEINEKMYKQLLDLSEESRKQKQNLDLEVEDDWELEI